MGVNPDFPVLTPISMDHDRFWLLAAKKLAGDANEEELLELETLIQQFPEALIMFRDAEQAWSQVQFPLQTDFSDQERIDRLKSKLHIDEEKGFGPSHKSRRILIYSTLLIILSVAAFWILNGSVKRPTTANFVAEKTNTVYAEKGARTKISLPDGSKVILNADSRIFYDNNFLKNRKLRLEGEGYFEVVKFSGKPFRIETEDMVVDVLGTTFNIRSYKDEKFTEAALIEGAIEIRIKGRKNEVIRLKPNEKIRVAGNERLNDSRNREELKRELALITINHIQPIESENLIREIAWTKNKLYFQSEPLEQIALTLERWYGKEIRIEDEKLAGINYTANFESESLLEVLSALQLSAPFRFRSENNRIIIY